MIAFLTWASVVLALAIVAVVAVYLVLILLALKRGADHLEALAGELVSIRNDTRPLEGKVATINRGLASLLPPLLAVNGSLGQIVLVASTGPRR